MPEERMIPENLYDYTGNACPACSRVRVQKWSDGKTRCEKCHWCVEDDDYDLLYEEYAFMRTDRDFPRE